MTTEEFLECVNGVDDDLVENMKGTVEENKDGSKVISAENLNFTNRYRRKIFKYIAAACITITIGIGIAYRVVTLDEKARVAESDTAKTVEQGGSLMNETGMPDLSGILGYEKLEFNYNNKNYVVINDEEFLCSNNLTSGISKSDIGVTLKMNVLDTTGNNILGDVYSYKNSSSQDIVILKANDGSYNFAFCEDDLEE